MRGKTSRCQWAPSCSQTLIGTKPSRILCRRPRQLGDEAQRGAEEVAAEPRRLGARRVDEQLVGDAARDRAARDQAVSLEDGHELRQPVLARRPRAARRGQPGELRMRVGQRRAGVVALVDEGKADAAGVVRAALPGLGHEVERRARELGDRVDVLGPVHDDLLPLERRIEVRHDAHVPAGRAVAEQQRLGRRPVLVAGAERAVLALVRRDRRGAGPPRASGRDRDPAAGRRVKAEVGHARRKRVS